jgi:hypothetical protein
VAVHAQKIVAAAEPAVEETAEPEVVGKAKEGEGEDAGEEKGEKPEKGDKPEKKEKAEKGDKGDKKK